VLKNPALPSVRLVVLSQNMADNILVDFQVKGFGQMLGDLGTTAARIAAFELTDGLDQIWRGPLADIGSSPPRTSGTNAGTIKAPGRSPDQRDLLVAKSPSLVWRGILCSQPSVAMMQAADHR
jgi:hypothetical protein